MMRGKMRFRSLLVLAASFALIAAACGNDGTSSGDGATTSAAPDANTVCSKADTSGGDLLAKICESGTIRVSTDPKYPPQSSLNVQTNEFEGFDIDVAKEIAKRLGVEIQWETPAFDLITAGTWNDRWDMSVGSVTVTRERMQALDFTPAYYYTPASVAVQADNNDITSAEQLSGKTIGSCTSCSYESYLEGTLDIPGYTFDFVIKDPVVKGYDTDLTAIQDLETGRLDAAMSATPTLQNAIDKGTAIKLVGDPLFFEPLSVAFDKESEADPTSIVSEVSNIIDEMHKDGTLTELSMKWYKGEDLTTPQS